MWNLFHRSKEIRKTGLLRGMTDVHSHLLSGVDDGIPTMEASLEALDFLHQEGIERIFLTPHLMEDLSDNRPAFLRERFAALQQRYQGPIQLRLCGEYMLDPGFKHQREEGLLTFPGKRVLMETSYMSAPPDWQDILYDLTLEGYWPIIAHPERYLYLRPQDYRQLKTRGYQFQMNLMSLAGVYGPMAARLARDLLKQGFYDYVGTDLHRKEVFDRALSHIQLTSSEEKELHRLLTNNGNLW
ncbi:MAG: tyrosine-protein phosphatase [Parabacteroides sp.]